ncbi:Imm8 family immunity protein [[Flexibacter] sp. ATCC 35208]|uniref:Imm8 family immunity protein n=1 Tax=[Flexibacter] sp. ATCC 35208 TaxID=1936242 RepID=UPI0009CAA320|nr:Imm8 family immunity protein [[Flexibacter] sp. ATCC 35208]OMP74686.1 hypothetical protein BW716_34065 [[Flexibacter] sp. ATCC 35208]
MAKIYVHDFNWEDATIENRNEERDFFYQLDVYYNFSKEDPGEGWENLTRFSISVATPMGIGKYLNARVKDGIYKGNFFFNYLLVVQENNKDEHLEFVKNSLESIKGRSEKELILKATRMFSWEYQDDYYGGINRLI